MNDPKDVDNRERKAHGARVPPDGASEGTLAASPDAPSKPRQPHSERTELDRQELSWGHAYAADRDGRRAPGEVAPALPAAASAAPAPSASPGAVPVAATGGPPAGMVRAEEAPFGGTRWDVVRALRHRDYRLFLLGAFLSNIGSWLQGVAEGYFVFTLTHSNALLGVMAFCNTIPVLVLGPIAGVTADRLHRKKVLIACQSLFLLTTGTLAILIYLHLKGIHHIQVWYLLVLAGTGGIAAAFNSPAYQSLTVEFVGPDDLMNAIALNSMQFNLSRIVGGLSGGYVYALFGPVWCFGLNSLSFLAVIIALLMVRIKPPSRLARSVGVLQNFRAGMKYLAEHNELLAIVGMAAALTIFAMPYFTLLPAFAVNVLHGDSRTQSQLLTAIGVGALLAAYTQASQREDAGKGRQMLWAMAAFWVCLIIFAMASRIIWTIMGPTTDPPTVWRASWQLSLVALVGCGAAMVGFMTTANTTMQLLVPDHMRGRLMGVFVIASFGLTPIGSLLMGLLAQRVGAPMALFWGALTAGLLTLIAALRYPIIRTL